MPSERHQPDVVLFMTVLMLTAIGVITVYSASTVKDLQANLPADFFAVRQLASAVLGCAIMFLLSRLRYQTLYKLAPLILLINGFLLVAVLIPGIGIQALGARRWIGTTSFHIQPSELAIVSVLIYLSFFFTKKVTLLHSFKKGLQPAMITVAFLFLLIFLEPDMGTGVTLLGAALVLVFASGARLKPLLYTVVGVIPLMYILAHAASYRSSRMTAFLHPFQNPGKAYQLLHGLTGIAAGGWFGRGFDMSVQKTGYLPIPQADFIFDVFTEEWGLVGAITLLAIFAIIIWRGFNIARHARDRFGALLAAGLTSMIIIKTIINLGAVTWLLPVTGIPLPFISYGGTSLIVNLAAMGILLSISRETLDEAPDADALADVIYVEEVRSLRKSVEKQPAAGLYSESTSNHATVSPLRRRNRGDAKEITHRSRLQKTPEKTSKQRTPSWRDRNAGNVLPSEQPVRRKTILQKRKD